MNTVVISGVAGMTGSEVARQLLAGGWRVVGFDTFFASSPAAIADLRKEDNFSFHLYDLNRPADARLLENELAGRSSKGGLAFVNCAAVVHTKHFYVPSATFETNVCGMKAFLELAVRVGAQQFINCSTSEVYSLKSFVAGGVLESDPLLVASSETSPRASYAIGKLLTEFFMREAVDLGRIRGCSLRFANVYSHDEFLPEHIIPYTIQTLRKGPAIVLLENARKTRRTFLHNNDSAAAVVRLLESDRALDGSAYNVGTVEEIGMVELVETIGAQMGVTPEITFAGVRSADPERRLLNMEKIRARTGWAPTVTLSQGIQLCLRHEPRGTA
ncbi:MAG: hypothetical protein RL077_4712 [Verrucomicrobiota bacterium]|jgi:dTDP-glucose 4,6-dehydratase